MGSGTIMPIAKSFTDHQLWGRAAIFPLFLAIVWASVTPAADWPLPRGDAQSTGATSTQLSDSLAVKWEFTAAEPVEATPVVAAGRVYIADVAGNLYALSADEGKELWKLKTEIGFIGGPAVDGDLLVIGDLDGKVYGVNALTGELIWTHDAGGEISSSASFISDRVLIASQDGNLYGLSRKDGTRVWTYETSDQIRCSPSIAGEKTFLGGCDGNLHTVSVVDGKSSSDPLPLGGPTGSTPAIADQLAFLPIMDGAVIAMNWKENREVWRYVDDERAQEYKSSPAVGGGLVIVASQGRQVDALDIATGKRKWRYTLRRRADASPVIAGNDVWLAATDGRLIRLSLADGNEKWNYEIRGQFTASPAIADDKLFIADSRGVVRCFAAP
jgi:outer membrane protein assembly factor BamB